MIWLSQWLCLARHCAVGIAWDDTKDTAENVEDLGEGIFATGLLNRRCGICGGGLRVEHRQTAWKSLAEAEGPLRVAEAQQLETRQALDALGASVDSARRN